MTDFNYKKYSLENLEKWLDDVLCSDDATPQEIYDVIQKVVSEHYYHHKHHVSRAYELMEKLNGSNNLQEQVKAHGELWDKEDVEAILAEREYYEPSMPPWGHSDMEYLVNQSKVKSCDKEDKSPECTKSWDDFWNDVDEKHRHEYNLREAEYYNKRAELDAKQDKVVKWVLPVEVDGLTGECYIQLPDDLLEVANLKEGDTIEWIDRKDGSFEMRKVDGTK